MSDYRRSYRKTILAAGAVSGSCLLMLGWATWSGWSNPSTWPWSAWVLWGLLWLTLVAVGGVSGLIATGGLISLHRDALEEQGVPYAPTRPREWQPGPLIRALRGAVRSATSVLPGSSGRLALRPGELVEVRTLDQILATLNGQGTLDYLPFMPEMSVLCGRQFRVFRRVEKVHDYVHLTGLRRIHDTVLLEQLRCDGRHHGGCQSSCHLLWKEAWLKRAGAGPVTDLHSEDAPARSTQLPPLRDADLVQLSRRTDEAGSNRYVCQMTEVARGTPPLKWGDPRHYLRDLIQGNVRLGPFLTGVALALFRWAQKKRGGAGFPNWFVPDRKTSPHQALALQAGELVRVKTKREIAETLNLGNRNRGLWFDAEMVRHCGGAYRVSKRVERIIEEKSGKLISVTNPSIILDGVSATGEYLAFCPQNEAIFWREIWLERVQAQPT